MENRKFKNFINNEFVDSISGRRFENRNPSDISQVLGTFPRSDKRDVEKAVKAANSSFPAWASTPAPERAEILYRAAQIMAMRKIELAKVISAENGKTFNSALGDVQSGIDMAFFAAGEGRRWYGHTSHSGLKKRFAMTKRYPVGVVAIITSWNFPMAITSWKTFPALICGNTVVLKSEENTPQTSVHFAEILQEAGLPKGVLNVIHGLGPEAGEALVRHPDISMVSFTGSSSVGKKIGTLCSEKLAKISLELGGKNAVLIMDDADLDLACDGVTVGAFSISGQRCTATSRVIVHKDAYGPFIERLLARIAQLKIGPGSDDSSDVTPLISEKQFQRVMKYISGAKREGAALLCGGEQLKGGLYEKGHYIQPTVFADVPLDAEIAREEVFGPVLVVFKASSYEDAIRIHNLAPYGLSASLFTKDVNKSFSFFDDAQAGVCYINAPTFGSEPHMPFGGVKNSGLGYREAGWAAIEAFSEVRTLYVDYSAKIQNVQFAKEE
jgi:aldehyde dehydrogenase (NAD+)